MNELSRLNKYFYKYRWRLLLGVAFVLLSNYFKVLQPQMVRYALDLVIENVALYQMYNGFESQEKLLSTIGSTLLLFGGLVLLLALTMGLFMFLMRQTIIVMSRLIEYDIRNVLFKHYEKLSLAFYKRNYTGDLMARVSEDVSRVRMYLGPALMYAVNLTGLCIMVISSMLMVSPTLTMYALIPLPFLSFSIYYLDTKIKRKSESIQQQLSTLTSVSQEVYSGVRVIKAYGRERSMGAAFEEDCEEYKERNLSLAKIEALLFPLMMLLIGSSTIIVIYVGGLLSMRGEITAGNIAEFVIYVNMLTWPVASIGWVASMIQRAAASQKRINEFLDTKPEILPPATAQKTPIQGNIEFKNVSFTYEDTGIQALKDISFSLKKGETLAIIGKTGSGKTTLMDLLVRMYDPTKGEVLIDGKPTPEHDLSNLRQNMGYVPQEVFLFSDTVANNIGFAMENAAQNQIEKYAAYAAIDEEIEGLPKQYETVVGERGVTLSGGQKQRISIARALIKQPQIILLDDCLSAVDTKTEAKISDYLQNECKDRTTIIITHRIYASLHFDKILVLEDGALTGVGTHEELLEQGGYYAELYERQKLEALEENS